MKHSIRWVGTFLLFVVISRVSAQDPASPFPPLNGWTFTQDSTVYTPDNLWDVIDGAADLFLEYGFVDLRIGRYQKSEDAEIRAELYRFNSASDAFGMYSQERSPKYRFTDIGIQAYREEGVLNFLTGAYYVKIMTHIRGEEALDAMTTIAKSLNVRLKQENSWPSTLNLLPSLQKQPNSEQYIANSFLGYSFLRRAYVAQYGNDKRFRVFIVAEESPENSEATFREFIKTVPGGVLDTTGREEYRVHDQYNGPIELLRTGKIVAGVVGLDDQNLAKTYLEDIVNRVRRGID